MNRAAMLGRPRFRTGDYLVTRTAAPTLAAGVEVPGSTTTFQTGDASLQPASGATLQVRPEGIHAQDVRDLWTTAALQVAPVPDRLTIAHEVSGVAEIWIVFQVRPWTGMGGQHFIASLARQATP